VTADVRSLARHVPRKQSDISARLAANVDWLAGRGPQPAFLLRLTSRTCGVWRFIRLKRYGSSESGRLQHDRIFITFAKAQ
jgi:hypothetical protein